MAVVPSISYVTAGARHLASHYNNIKDYLDWLKNKPGCSAYRTVVGTIANNSWTAVGMDSEDYDRDGMHNTATNNARMTFNTAGRYRISARLSWTPNGTGVRGMQIRLNSGGAVGGGTFMTYVFMTGISGQEAVLTDSWSRVFNEGDYVEMFSFQTSGGSLTYETGIRKVMLEAVWEGTD